MSSSYRRFELSREPVLPTNRASLTSRAKLRLTHGALKECDPVLPHNPAQHAIVEDRVKRDRDALGELVSDLAKGRKVR